VARQHDEAFDQLAPLMATKPGDRSLEVLENHMACHATIGTRLGLGGQAKAGTELVDQILNQLGRWEGMRTAFVLGHVNQGGDKIKLIETAGQLARGCKQDVVP
jgi:hypothetical protein